MADITFLSAQEMARQVAQGQVSAVDLLTAHFDQVDRVNPQVNAVIWQDRGRAMEEARACDAEQSRGSLRGPLHGVPVTVKESFDLTGSPATWGDPAWKDVIATTDADLVARYRAAGAVVYGKTNVPLNLVEWQSFNDVYGSTSNPWDLARTPGGSSGGSGAALAAGMSALELGSDIGSSIRNPAHFCGVFGLKPTWGALSMQGHKRPGWYGDTDIGAGGPLARSAGDLALAFDVLLGPSRFEASQFLPAHPEDPRTRLSEFRVAVKLGDPASPVDQPYLDALDDFARKIEAAGGPVIRDRLPEIDSEAHFTTYLRLLGAALSMSATDEGIAEMRARIDAEGDIEKRVFGHRIEGQAISHREWLALDNERRKARLAFDAFFEDVDILLAPVAASAAPLKDEVVPRYKRRIEVNGRPQLEPLELFWSGYSGVVGLPSLVGPMGRVGHLPVGYQAIAGHGRDRTALAFAAAAEREIADFSPPPMAFAAPPSAP
ncbi:Aspartyl-tRNA(Asn) amidotransferase subunit A [Candidatus Rhodobacter oscarellae]|uniref:Aspartyl-tRNA(Asn) amidotransferase subunit A n=1 Tax=Candidatus Rhodobacter oscarellae TaxID=1675527 RepID=A0A0J9E7A6_9RHOB|nr:amidase family protein [Candidatus Rhodobacter lobularis]KMW58635.1 Aspartyl-tRNA(Asn) amidotransferase subunit A [Candidatus Rhodobacter lobularis]